MGLDMLLGTAGYATATVYKQHITNSQNLEHNLTFQPTKGYKRKRKIFFIGAL